MIKLKYLALLFSSTIYAAGATEAQLVSHADAKIEIQNFAKQMAEQHQFDQQKLTQQLLGLKYRADIIAKMTRPAESMPWYKYRPIWMQEKRIDGGVEFWNTHAATLDAAYEKYGVDPAIIVGIIGVETFYGRIQGSHPVIEALHTLGFYYPKRSKFFRSELAEYLILARDQKWDINQVKGSYAGAMGMGQFISSSYRHYGIDFNNDGKVNLFTDTEDMIGSVANYFSRHHWTKGGFIAAPVSLSKQQQTLVQADLVLQHSPEKFAEHALDVSALKNKSNKAGVFAFDLADDSQEHWLVGDNFYVITRYNHNAMYALAAFQLSEAIKAKRAQALSSTPVKPIKASTNSNNP